MDNYRRFASKYDGKKPKLDPLVAKMLKADDDRSPGRNMQSMTNISQSSLPSISVKYNEGSALTQKNNLLKKGHFARKSMSLKQASSKKSLHQMISTKHSPSRILLRNNSNDLADVLDNASIQ